jgi:hypothetical protein
VASAVQKSSLPDPWQTSDLGSCRDRVGFDVPLSEILIRFRLWPERDTVKRSTARCLYGERYNGHHKGERCTAQLLVEKQA